MNPSAPATPTAGQHAAVPVDGVWFVVHTKPRLEALACEHLQRQAFEVYLPMFKTFRPPRGRRAHGGDTGSPPQAGKPGPVLTAAEPMFPRYLFMRPTRATQSLSSVRSTQGVTRLVMFGTQPARLADALVQGIRRAEALRDQATVADVSPYQPGMPVRLLDPALGGLRALVDSVSKDRVTLLLEILGRPQLVSVDFERIAPL